MRTLIIKSYTIPIAGITNVILHSTGFDVEDNGELMAAFKSRVSEGADERLKVLVAYGIAKDYDYEIRIQYVNAPARRDYGKLLEDCLTLIQNTYPNPLIINFAKEVTHEIY